MTNYPTAYRKESRQYPQPGERIKPGRGIQPPRPVPANDNSFPANDNFKIPQAPEKVIRRVAGEAIRQAAKRVAPKLVPGLNVASVAADVIELVAPSVIEWIVTRDPDVVVPRPGGADFRSWEWSAKPINYPGDRPGFISWWDSPVDGYYGSLDFADIPGVAAEMDINAKTRYGTLAKPGTQWEMRMPEVYVGPTAENPWFVTVPGQVRRTQSEVAPELINPRHVRAKASNDKSLSESGTPEPEGDPFVRPDPGNRPNEMVVVVSPPGVNPASNPAPRTHASRAPQGKKEKEKKWVMTSKHIVQRIFGAVTEASDFIDALWEALPKNKKGGYYKLHGKGGKVFYKWRHKVSVTRKLQDLYNGYEDLDMNDALHNIAVGQLEDAAIGKLGKKAQQEASDSLEMLKRPVGFGFGPGM